MELETIKRKLIKRLSKEKYIHSISVMDTAVDMARHYGVFDERFVIAGLLHDCAKDISTEEMFKLCVKYHVKVDIYQKSQPALLHGALGAEIAKHDFEIEDEEILRSIKYHTTGCENMGMFEKIIYMADYIEPGRCFLGVKKLRKLSYKNIDQAMVEGLNMSIKEVIKKKGLIHPDTIHARNSILVNCNLQKGK